MPRPDDLPDDLEVWVYVASNSSYIDAFDTQNAALDAALNQDDPSPWVECVTLKRSQEGTGAPHSPEQRPEASPGDEVPTRASGGRRRSWIAPPQLTIPGRWHTPGPGAA